jgi:hypothetical protein
MPAEVARSQPAVRIDHLSTGQQRNSVARIAAPEILSTGALVFLLASAGNDPDLSKGRAILESLQVDGFKGLDYLPKAIQDEARAYLTDLLNNALQNVAALRGASTSAS